MNYYKLKAQFQIAFHAGLFRGACISSLPINAYSTRWYQGVLEYTGIYKLFDMCHCEGNGFQTV